ncbi:MAG: stage II sporulation protein P [Clostridia bacterium]|nr:stage II sporulation protein P [Clostridia bacterium]
MRLRPKCTAYKFILQIAALLALCAVLCLTASHNELQPQQLAHTLLAYRFPFSKELSLNTVLSNLTDNLLGFRPGQPQSILANQFPFFRPAPISEPAPVDASPSSPPIVAQPENTLPIVETCQTVAALKNTEGANKQIFVDNATSYDINIAQLLSEPLQLKTSADVPRVLIVHTHTTESYTPEGQDYYAPSDSTRTQDKTQNVVRVGEEIARTLTEKGINVLHDTTINDYPSYNGSYTKTLGIIEWYLERYPSIQIVLDIHRDGMTRSDGTKLKVTADIHGEKAAQVMLVIGTNEGGLTHENWRENLKLGLRVQDKLTSLYPKLARPLNLRKERFNQHATPGSMIVEVGTDGNTLAEAITAGKYFATAFAEVLHEIKQ